MNFLKNIDLEHFSEILKSRKVWLLVIAIVSMKMAGVPGDKIGDMMEYAMPALLVAHGMQNKTEKKK
jgi:hypothetical protein